MPAVSVRLDDKEISNVELTNDSYVIGRSEECEIQIDNLGVSRQHARLQKSGDGYAVSDMGSVNGVFVNGEQVEGARELADGDEILVGKFVLKYKARIRKGKESTVVSTMKMDEDTIRRKISELEREKREKEGES